VAVVAVQGNVPLAVTTAAVAAVAAAALAIKIIFPSLREVVIP
jgi:hypothetical protein